MKLETTDYLIQLLPYGCVLSWCNQVLLFFFHFGHPDSKTDMYYEHDSSAPDQRTHVDDSSDKHLSRILAIATAVFYSRGKTYR